MPTSTILDNEQSFYLDRSRSTASLKVTFSVWFDLPPATDSASGYLALLTRQWAYGLYIKKDSQNKYQLVCFDFNINRGDVLHAKHEFPATAASPYHAVFTLDGNHATLYLNGILQNSITDFSIHNLDGQTYIGASDNYNPNDKKRAEKSFQQYPGSIKRATLFNRCLSAGEVARLFRRGTDKFVLDLQGSGKVIDFKGDKIKKDPSGNLIPIRVFENLLATQAISTKSPSTYPFEISLTNQKDNTSPALYIVSDVARTTDVQKIDITIKNTTSDTYQFDSFTLSFRKGTLHEDLTKDIEAVKAQIFCTLLKTALGPNAVVTVTEDHDNINFLVKKSTTEKFRLASQSTLTLPLAGVYAAPGTGTRTSGYEVKFQGVQKMVGTTPSGSAFTFGRNAVLQIINHQGVSYAPVHFGVLGNNFLLNNNNAGNEVNSPEAPAFTIFMQSLDGKALKMNEKTKFIFTFYSSEKRDGTSMGNDGSIPFGNRSEVDAITVGTLASGYSSVAPSSVDKYGKRDIIITSTAGLEESFVAFPFNNIQLSGTPGIIKVHVTVENLPGYWDSKFEVPFVKGPIVMAGDQVGINMPPSETNKLSIKGNTYIDGTTRIKDHLIFNSNNAVINWGNTGKLYFRTNTNLGNETVYQNTVIIDQNGNVGIGTAAPTSKLEVNGDALIYNKTTIGKANANADLIVNGNVVIGNVVIGTDAPTAELEVKGRIKDQTGYVMPVGSIIAYGGEEAPKGWLLCNGQSLTDKEDNEKINHLYEELSNVLGKAKNVPDLSGRFILGVGEGTDLNKQTRSFTLNESDGGYVHWLDESEMPSHGHKSVGEDSTNWQYGVSDDGPSFRAKMLIDSMTVNKNKYLYGTTPTGGNQPHNNMPPYYVLTYIIKY